MRKIFLFALAFAGLFLAGSCQRENLEPVTEGNTVTYTVEIPQGIATKASGDGFKLHYEVYRQHDLSNLEALPVYEGTETFVDGSADLELEFVKNQQFTVLFWAQKSDGVTAYDITDLREVSLASLTANDLNAEVFAGKDKVVNCASVNEGNIKLVRPVAQLNIATTAESLNLGINASTPATVNPTESMVVVDGLYGTYNVANGTPGAKAERTYAAAAVTCEEFKTSYKLMATNYLGFIPADGDVVEVSFTIYTEKDGNIEHTVSNVPVKPNYQTNIIGNLISATADYTVTIEEAWGEPIDVELIEADSADKFAQAVNLPNAQILIPENTTYTLPATIAEGVIIIGSEGSVIDYTAKYCNNLKNVTFKNIKIVDDKVAHNGGIQHSESVSYVDCVIEGIYFAYAEEVMFKGCTFTEQTDNYPVWVYGSDRVTFEDCTFKTALNKGVLIFNEGPKEFDVTLENCSFNATECLKNKAAVQIHAEKGISGNLVINNCTTVNYFDQTGRGTLWSEVNNSTDPETPTNNFNVTVDGVHVALVGYTQVANYPGLWTKDGEYFVFDLAGLKDLHKFFAANSMDNSTWGKTYNIGADIDAEGYTWDGIWMNVGDNSNDGIVLDGNNHTISNLTINNYMFASTPAGGNEGVKPGEVKNITMKNPVVNGSSHDATVFWGYCYTNVDFTNVVVDGAVISGGSNVGALMSRTAIESANGKIALKFTDCKVINSTLKADDPNADPTGASAFIGRAYGNTTIKFSGCEVDNNTIINENGLVGGKVYGYTTWVGDGFTGTGACDTFTDFHGVQIVNVGTAVYASFTEAIEAVQAGETVTLVTDVTLSEELEIPAGIILNGNGKQINGSIYAGGDLTFAGHTKVTKFSAAYYDHIITIGNGACLEVTGGDRVTFGYGNTFNITGSIADAKKTDKTTIQPSMIIPAGLSITGSNDFTMNLTNAYVQIGNTSSKNKAANGTFTLNIENSIVDFTDQFTFAEPTNGMNPTFVVNLKNSVITTTAKFCIAAPNTTVTLDNSSITTASNVRNSGTINLTNGSILSGNTIQFGENGGNDGTINVDSSTLNIAASDAGHAFDGQGRGFINLQNNANATITYYKNMALSVDKTSTFTGTDVTI